MESWTASHASGLATQVPPRGGTLGTLSLKDTDSACHDIAVSLTVPPCFLDCLPEVGRPASYITLRDEDDHATVYQVPFYFCIARGSATGSTEAFGSHCIASRQVVRCSLVDGPLSIERASWCRLGNQLTRERRSQEGLPFCRTLSYSPTPPPSHARMFSPSHSCRATLLVFGTTSHFPLLLGGRRHHVRRSHL